MDCCSAPLCINPLQKHPRAAHSHTEIQLTKLTACVVDVEERRERIALRHQTVPNLARIAFVAVLRVHLQNLHEPGPDAYTENTKTKRNEVEMCWVLVVEMLFENRMGWVF